MKRRASSLAVVATSDPGAVVVPIPAPPCTEWTVPVEMVLRGPSSSLFHQLIRDRIGRGDQPLTDARIYLRGNRYFAEVFFPGPNRPGVFMALDVWKGVTL